MHSGKILVSDTGGNYIIKLVGDVRVTLCTSFKSYIDGIFSGDPIVSVLIDLTETKALDSTTLGLLAKIAMHEGIAEGVKPLIITQNKSILRLLESMGFEDIFTIRKKLPSEEAELTEIPFVSGKESQTCSEVIEAHKALMSLNAENKHAFKDLVSALEQQN